MNFALGLPTEGRPHVGQAGLPIRRILLKDGSAYSIRPSFLMPYMTAHAADVEGPLFLRKFGVPFWALARVFGATRCPGIAWSAGWAGPASWERPSSRRCPSTCGRRASSSARWPEDLHRHHGRRRMLPGSGAGRGGGDRRVEGRLRVFKDEARDPRIRSQTVSTDGWKGTQAAWKVLFPKVVFLLCFLHGWLKIRDRAKHLKEQFAEISRRVWEAYHVPNRRSFAQRLRPLRQWAADSSPGSCWRSLGPVWQADAGRSPTATPAATARATCWTA